MIISKCIIIILQADSEEYGWEYASLGRQTFHTTKGRFDVVRRRRHVRKLVNERPGAKAVFTSPAKTEGVKVVKYEDASSKDGRKKPQMPRMHLEFKGKAIIYKGQCTVPHLGLQNTKLSMSLQHLLLNQVACCIYYNYSCPNH
jgi:hypothetical protein